MRVAAGQAFRLEPVGDRVHVTTETRFTLADRRAHLRFGFYWLVIRPGSGFIRRMQLRAIRKRAETL